MSEWQPIAIAPTDGTEVLVYVPRRLGALYASALNTTGKQWWSRNLGDLQPSHWMPLPEPPTVTEKLFETEETMRKAEER